VIIAGSVEDPATAALLAAAHAAWPPDRALLVIDPSCADDTRLWGAHNPQALAMVQAHAAKLQAAAGGSGGEGGGFVPTAFVCQNYTCKAPTTDPHRLLALLREAGTGARAPGAAAGVAAFTWPGPPPAAAET
jgi:hypothetical protein